MDKDNTNTVELSSENKVIRTFKKGRGLGILELCVSDVWSSTMSLNCSQTSNPICLTWILNFNAKWITRARVRWKYSYNIVNELLGGWRGLTTFWSVPVTGGGWGWLGCWDFTLQWTSKAEWAPRMGDDGGRERGACKWVINKSFFSCQ